MQACHFVEMSLLCLLKKGLVYFHWFLSNLFVITWSQCSEFSGTIELAQIEEIKFHAISFIFVPGCEACIDLRVQFFFLLSLLGCLFNDLTE